MSTPVTPQERLLVPILVTDDAVEKIKDGTVTRFTNSIGAAGLVERTLQ